MTKFIAYGETYVVEVDDAHADAFVQTHDNAKAYATVEEATAHFYPAEPEPAPVVVEPAAPAAADVASVTPVEVPAGDPTAAAPLEAVTGETVIG